uniref:Uncharacterized protein n=1 Tax=Tetranychus urticae TaxID=32264 RepID=T1K9F1_TETUR
MIAVQNNIMMLTILLFEFWSIENRWSVYRSADAFFVEFNPCQKSQL